MKLGYFRGCVFSLQSNPEYLRTRVKGYVTFNIFVQFEVMVMWSREHGNVQNLCVMLVCV